MGKTWYPFMKKKTALAFIKKQKRKYRYAKFRILKRKPKWMLKDRRFKRAKYVVAEYW